MLFGALWLIFGEHAQAGSGSIWPFSVSGRSVEHGEFSVHILPHGGRGAMRDLDGMVPIAFPHNSAVTPVEIWEAQCPVMITQKALLPNSGGAGRRRGGLGQVMTFRNIGEVTINARVRPDKVWCPAPGLDGAAPGATGRVTFNGREIHEYPILPFAPGDEITLEMPGGAGFGPASDREPAYVARDVALGYVSSAAAARCYGKGTGRP